MVHDEGAGSTVTTIATLTATAGKDLYLGRAFVSAVGTNSGTSIQSGKIALKENGTIVGEWSFTYSDHGGGSTLPTTAITSDSFEFPLSGNKVGATGTFTLEIISIGQAITFEGQLVGFQETTNESPQIPST